MSTSRVIARNTAAQVAGEVLSRVASLGLYVVMARALGRTGFGEFTVALSLSTLLLVLAGAGTESLISRETARDREQLHHLLWNANAIKLVLGTIAIAIAVVVSMVGHYSADVRVAVPLLGAAALIELLSKNLYAVFVGVDDMRPGALSLVLQRSITAAAGITALVLGAGIVAVAVIFIAGALVGLAYSSRALGRRVGKPRREVSVSAARRLLLVAAPIGVAAVFNAVLFRVDTVILSLMKSEAAVGLYGAAYRVLDSTLFLSYAFVAALVPSLSRLTPQSSPTVGETYEFGAKILATALFPLGVGAALFAGPVVRLVYGAGFTEAATALRLLGGTIALYGFSYLSSVLLVSQDRQRLMPWITGAVAVENIVLNVLLIPRYSFDGAAFATTVTELTRATVLIAFCVGTTGRISPLRIAAGPALGCGAMGLVTLLVGTGPVGIAAAVVAYPLTLLVAEHRLFPGDVRRLLDSVLRRRSVTEQANLAPS